MRTFLCGGLDRQAKFSPGFYEGDARSQLSFTPLDIWDILIFVQYVHTTSIWISSAPPFWGHHPQQYTQQLSWFFFVASIPFLLPSKLCGHFCSLLGMTLFSSHIHLWQYFDSITITMFFGTSANNYHMARCRVVESPKVTLLPSHIKTRSKSWLGMLMLFYCLPFLKWNCFYLYYSIHPLMCILILVCHKLPFPLIILDIFLNLVEEVHIQSIKYNLTNI